MHGPSVGGATIAAVPPSHQHASYLDLPRRETQPYTRLKRRLKSRFKIFSDPVHGFISVPKNLLLDLIQTPEVQRLRRIRQLGLGHLVFPGAEHTRFGHALGAMALMQDTLSNLSEKGTPVSAEEQTAAMAAALLHDKIGRASCRERGWGEVRGVGVSMEQ